MEKKESNKRKPMTIEERWKKDIPWARPTGRIIETTKEQQRKDDEDFIKILKQFGEYEAAEALEKKMDKNGDE